MLAGPGTIATAMNFAAGSSLSQISNILLAFGLMCFVTYIAFITCQRLARLLGQNGINVISKLMGLILTVVGVQMIIDGVLALTQVARWASLDGFSLDRMINLHNRVPQQIFIHPSTRIYTSKTIQASAQIVLHDSVYVTF